MKVDKNSPLGEMLLKMAAEHDPKLRRAIRNDEVGDLNIIALGAPDDEIKDLLESLFMGEDKCKNCGEVKAATPTDADDALPPVRRWNTPAGTSECCRKGGKGSHE